MDIRRTIEKAGQKSDKDNGRNKIEYTRKDNKAKKNASVRLAKTFQEQNTTGRKLLDFPNKKMKEFIKLALGMRKEDKLKLQGTKISEISRGREVIYRWMKACVSMKWLSLNIIKKRNGST